MSAYNEHYREYFPHVPLFNFDNVTDFTKENMNLKLETINGSINQLNSELLRIAKSSPEYMIEFFKNNSDPYFVKSFDYQSLNPYFFSDFYSNNGQISNIPSDCFILPCNEIKNQKKEDITVMVFHENTGKLLAGSEVIVSDTQDGLNIFVHTRDTYTMDYVIDKEIPHKFHVVVFRKFILYDFARSDQIVASDNTSTFLKTVVQKPSDKNYIRVFQKNLQRNVFRTPDSYLRTQVSGNDDKFIQVSVEKDPNQNTEINIPMGQYIVQSTFDWIDIDLNVELDNGKWDVLYRSNTTYFSEKTFEDLNQGYKAFKIPLFRENELGEKIPFGFNDERDFLVFSNGNKLRPFLDYKIKENDIDGIFIELQGYYMDYNQSHFNLRVIKNLPCNDICTYEVNTDVDNTNITELSMNTNLLRGESALMFSGTRLVPMQEVESITGNWSHVDGLEINHIELYNNVIENDSTKEFLESSSNYESQVDKFLKLADQNVTDDILIKYRQGNNIPTLPLGDYVNPGWIQLTEDDIGTISSPRHDMLNLEDQVIQLNSTITAKTGEVYTWYVERGLDVPFTDGDNAAGTTFAVPNVLDMFESLVRLKRVDVNGLVTITNPVRFLYDAENDNPVIVVHGYRESVPMGTEFILNASATYDNDGTVFNYKWECDDASVELVETDKPFVIVRTDKVINPKDINIKLTVTDTEYNAQSYIDGVFIEIGTEISRGAPDYGWSEQTFKVTLYPVAD